jgi:hypothetical protein
MVSDSSRARELTSQRWQAAARRAIQERVEVRQINESGAWVATSGTDPVLCYLLEIHQGMLLRCTCPAGAYGDQCCKHAARFYLDTGVIELEEVLRLRLVNGVGA